MDPLTAAMLGRIEDRRRSLHPVLPPTIRGEPSLIDSLVT